MGASRDRLAAHARLVGVDQLRAPEEQVDLDAGVEQGVVRPQPFGDEAAVPVGGGVLLQVDDLLDARVGRADLLQLHDRA